MGSQGSPSPTVSNYLLETKPCTLFLNMCIIGSQRVFVTERAIEQMVQRGGYHST